MVTPGAVRLVLRSHFDRLGNDIPDDGANRKICDSWLDAPSSSCIIIRNIPRSAGFNLGETKQHFPRPRLPTSSPRIVRKKDIEGALPSLVEFSVRQPAQERILSARDERVRQGHPDPKLTHCIRLHDHVICIYLNLAINFI